MVIICIYDSNNLYLLSFRMVIICIYDGNNLIVISVIICINLYLLIWTMAPLLIIKLLKVPKRVTPFGATVDHSLVEHQTVPFLLSDQFHLFGSLVAVKMIGIDD